MATEWDQPWPNEWRAELPLLAAAVSAFQGWSGTAVYTYRHTFHPTSAIEAPFEAALDPARFGLFPHAALLYRRDVRPAKETVTVRLDPEQALSGNPMAQWDRPTALIASPELHRVQVRFGTAEEAKAWPGETVEPFDEVVPHDATSVRSDTGQLWRSWDIGYGTIDTPGTQAVYGTRGLFTEVKLTDIQVELESRFATVAVSSLTGDPIGSSERLLVSAVGRAENSGMVYNLHRTLVLETGTGPVLLEPVRGEVRIRTQHADLKVTAIDTSGRAIQPIAAPWQVGWLRIPLGKPAVTMYYLVEKR